MKKQISKKDTAGGWSSVNTVATSLLKQHVMVEGSRQLMRQNKKDGFVCVGCAWAKPANSHPFEFCQHGALATTWELTKNRAGGDFFANHTLLELSGWSDHDLEKQGRLIDPMKWDEHTDTYTSISWAQAFEEIGTLLKSFDPESVVWYTSGRASLEASYMYQLMVRMYGSNNLPDSSNMCHESTSVGLLESIGVGVGTVVLDDFSKTECILFFGQNVGTNSPRMLHDLQDARKRDVPIITFNPIKECGLQRFVNPQNPLQLVTEHSTEISTQYLQVKPGGDIAAIAGMCKSLLELEASVKSDLENSILDWDFIEEHTNGFNEFKQFIVNTSWLEIEQHSGLSRLDIEAAASVYARAKSVIAVYGMGLTQHRNGVLNVQMLANLMMLRGNLGKPGAGLCPVRGHSNVQGQRTVGITEKPELAPMKKLKELYDFDPPIKKGLNTVEACKCILNGSVKAFVSLGGNFLRAIPDTDEIEPAWDELSLTVNIATKLNRSHIRHGKQAYLLPCLGRTEQDIQSTGPQSVSIEDSTGCMHGSLGDSQPAADILLSEPAIIAGIAKATLSPACKVNWDEWVNDYSKIRTAIEETFPKIFSGLENRRWIPGGFRRPMPVTTRTWNTPNHKANFITPQNLVVDPDTEYLEDDSTLRLFTIRSDSQFNTSIYGLHDKFRGLYGDRKVLLMHPQDIASHGFEIDERVSACTVAKDGVKRMVTGLAVKPYDLPKGSVAGYFPECNPLIPLWHHAKGSMVPASKSIPIKLMRMN